VEGYTKSQQKSFLFTNVIDSRGKKYDIPVAYSVFDFFDLGLKCPEEEVQEKVAQGIMHPLEPRLVDSGPVQEVVYSGKRLLEKGGLDELPVPIATRVGMPAPLIQRPAGSLKTLRPVSVT